MLNKIVTLFHPHICSWCVILAQKNQKIKKKKKLQEKNHFKKSQELCRDYMLKIKLNTHFW